MGFTPASNLVFVINFQETKKRLSTFWLCVTNFLGSGIDYDQSDQQQHYDSQSRQQCDEKVATLVTPASVVSSNSSQPCQQQLWTITNLVQDGHPRSCVPPNNDLFMI